MANSCQVRGTPEQRGWLTSDWQRKVEGVSSESTQALNPLAGVIQGKMSYEMSMGQYVLIAKRTE